MELRAGDTVYHRPSKETWTVAYVDGARLSWCGWPYGEAEIADCDVITRCSEAYHIKLLKQIDGDGNDRGYDRRARMARVALEKVAARTEDPTRQREFKDLISLLEQEESEGARLQSQELKRKMSHELADIALRKLETPTAA
jgi:hypothetical protein